MYRVRFVAVLQVDRRVKNRSRLRNVIVFRLATRIVGARLWLPHLPNEDLGGVLP